MTTLKLTARQTKFLTVAATEYGYDPYDPPIRGPILQNDELDPMKAAGLVVWSDDLGLWFATEAGKEWLEHGETK